MKLFLRDHLMLIGIYLLQLLVTLYLFWLDSPHLKVWTLAYACLLSTCFLLLYLGYRYYSLHVLYRRLSNRFSSLDESVETLGNAPLAESIDQMLQDQYAHYHRQLHDYERRLRDHVTLINQWVHQMKTPLSVIHLTIQEEDDPLFNSIREETDRLRKGLETILYSSRLDAFEHDFHIELVNLAAIVRQVIAENKAYFIRNRVYPEILIAKDCHVYSDDKWLAFLIGQVVTNAIRYSAGTETKVTFSLETNYRHVVLEIRDRGVGIPEKDIKRVFDPYFTGENGRVFRESTGMGLYLVRQICAHLDHQVELDSTVGVGTTVRLFFRRPHANLTRA